MNSVLQLMYSIPELRKAFTKSKAQKLEAPALVKSLRDLFADMTTDTTATAVAAKEYVSSEKMKKYHKHIKCDFSFPDQHDAMEYLLKLVNKLLEADPNFFIEFASSIRFLEKTFVYCKNDPSTPHETKKVSSIAIQLTLPEKKTTSSTLQNRIIQFESKEQYNDNDEDRYTEKCATNTATDRVVQEKEHGQDIGLSRRGEATEREIKIECTNATKYIIISLKRFNKKGEKLSNKIAVNKKLTISGKTFKIVGCILHVGSNSINSGHYVYHLYDTNGTVVAEYNDAVRKIKTDNFTYKEQEDINGYIFLYRLIVKAAAAAPAAAAPAVILVSDDSPTPPAKTATPPSKTPTPPAKTATPPAKTATPPAKTATPPATEQQESRIRSEVYMDVLSLNAIAVKDKNYKSNVYQTTLYGYPIEFCRGAQHTSKDNYIGYYYIYLLRTEPSGLKKVVMPLGLYEYLLVTTEPNPTQWGAKIKERKNDTYLKQPDFFSYVTPAQVAERLNVDLAALTAVPFQSAGGYAQEQLAFQQQPDTLWIRKLMKSNNYNQVETKDSQRSNTFFEAVAVALKSKPGIVSDDTKIDISSLRQALSKHIPKDWFQYKTDLFNAAVAIDTSLQEQISTLHKQVADLITENSALKQKVLQNKPSDALQLSMIQSTLNQLVKDYKLKQQRLDMLHKQVTEVRKYKYKDLKASSHSTAVPSAPLTFEKFQTLLTSTPYAPDDMAMTVLEDLFHFKTILLNDKAEKIEQALQCRRHHHDLSVSKHAPKYYIILSVDKDQKYNLITYAPGHLIFEQHTIPYGIKQVVTSQCGLEFPQLQTPSPSSSPYIKRLRANASTCTLGLCSENVVLQFNDSSVHESVGLGVPSEYIPATVLQEYLPLAVIHHWRRMLSNGWTLAQGFKVDNDVTLWSSVDNYFQAKEQEASAQTSEGLANFYKKNGPDQASLADQTLQRGLTAKFKSDPQLLHALLATKDAKLMIILPANQGVVLDVDLMTVRNTLLAAR